MSEQPTDIVTFCDDSNPFTRNPRQQVDGNAKYLRIVARTYNKDGTISDEILFTGDKFREGSEHNGRLAVCHCAACASKTVKAPS